MIRLFFYVGEFLYFFVRYGFSTAREKAIPPWKEDAE